MNRRLTPVRGGLRGQGFSRGVLVLLILFGVAIAGTAWVGTGIVARERWPIRWLELNGPFQRISAEQLRSSLAPLVSASFFTLDLQRLRDAAMRNPWAASVVVQKQWPDTVRVTVEEHRPVAHWNSGRLVSAQGVEFPAPDADGIQGLPWLRGPDERLDDVLAQWVRFNTMLDSAGLEVDRLVLDQRGSWSMIVSGGTHLELGRDEPVERLERLMASWNPLLRNQPLPPLAVDLRYTNGFAVRWPEPSADLAGNDN
ncbi:cell division protein FtsQ/DivIB [Elongatibacter sediminis]|uniref:Cell division protein FtsQ n=1 Tax=Elongatibacter sediminis TaxID=3119006 RepID=A0AAW9RHD5_9GAMM